MIGTIKTGTLNSSVISAVAYEGLTIKTNTGKPARLAIIDENGNVIEAGETVAREAWNVAIAAYKNLWIGKGHLRVFSNASDIVDTNNKVAA